MRKSIIKVLFIIIPFVFFTPVVSALTCTNLPKFLSKGFENSDVLTLQKFLADEGYLVVKPNGYFGENTKKAVTAFQKKQNITQTGAAGPLTRSKIKEITCTATSESGNALLDNVIIGEKEKTIVVAKNTQATIPVQMASPAQESSTVTPQVVAPTIYVKTFLATDVTSESAILKGSGGVDGEKHWFEWGTTMEMKSTTTQTNTPTSYSYTLTGLAPNTSYYFRAVTSVASSTDRKAETAYGEMRYFTTPAKAVATAVKVSPTVSITTTGVAVNAGGSAKVTWTSTNTNTCTFTQGENGGTWTQQNSLSGQYMTLPMTSSAVFSISCKDIDGYVVTSSVTVPKIVN